LQLGVPGAVALERAARSVEGIAVQLDHQGGVRPERVDLEAGDVDVDGRRWEAGVAAEVEEALFQLGARFRQRTVVLRKPSTEGWSP
jgi:hypothetical protein